MTVIWIGWSFIYLRYYQRVRLYNPVDIIKSKTQFFRNNFSFKIINIPELMKGQTTFVTEIFLYKILSKPKQVEKEYSFDISNIQELGYIEGIDESKHPTYEVRTGKRVNIKGQMEEVKIQFKKQHYDRLIFSKKISDFIYLYYDPTLISLYLPKYLACVLWLWTFVLFIKGELNIFWTDWF